MEIIQEKLSSLSSPDITSNLLGLEYKQIRRTYPGNLSINFPLCLSGCNDFGVKNYTNFYLTNKFKISDILNVDNNKTLASKITTSIKFGDYVLYANMVDTEYGIPLFDLNTTHPPLTIEFFDNNRCQIYHNEGLYRYYLVVDVDHGLFFVKSKYLSFDTTTINPQDFVYMFAEDERRIFFFKNTTDGNFFITKNGNSAVAVQIYETGIISYITKDLEIGKDIYFDPTQQLDCAFITYNSDNKINSSKSDFNLTNNFLLSREYSFPNVDTNLLILKNQLLQQDVFSSSNNMLSGDSTNLFVNDLREYTTIFNDIPEELSTEIELNYVFYNKTYKISPGTNTFISPSSMYPFTKLNINDSKFISSGAFSNSSPLYSDKIYAISDKPQNSINGQYLLCTWLSGSPFSENKMWVDRYYYPDLIEKETALASEPELIGTYDNYLEKLLQSNQNLKTEVAIAKFFDKKSDFLFEPNKSYTYDRIFLEFPTNSITYCNDFMTSYFENINTSGKMTFAYYFGDEDNDWTIFTDRNSIDCGVTITKTGHILQMTYKIYEPSTQTYETFHTESEIPINNNGIVVFSLDSLRGVGYFMLNNTIVLQFTLAPYQYTIKQLIYNNFYIRVNGTKTDLLLYTWETGNSYISTDFFEPDRVFSIPLMFRHLKIDNLFVTLPCGMRNGSDNIEFLQTACGSSTFKSNNINVLVKNLNIDNENILDGIKDTITTSIKPFLPVNSKINNITFQNFK